MSLSRLKELSDAECALAEVLGHNDRNNAVLSLPPPPRVYTKEAPPASSRPTISLTALLTHARDLSQTMGAPPSWVVNTPMIGFVPPAPFPHQIRSGVLNTLELSSHGVPPTPGQKLVAPIPEPPPPSDPAPAPSPSAPTWKPGDAIKLSEEDLKKLEAAKAEKKRKREEKEKRKHDKKEKKKKKKKVRACEGRTHSLPRCN